MAVQERNSEMVSLLSADFIQKTDTVYLAGIITGCILALPGLVAFWPMGISLSDSTDIYADYAYLPGRSGGQTLNGGTAAGDDLTLTSTSNATKGDVLIQPGGGNTSVGGSLAVARGTSNDGALRVDGTTYTTLVNHSTNEDTYLRGGKASSIVYINDGNIGDVILVNGGKNVGIGGSSFAGGNLVLFLRDGTAPSGTPSGGGILYVESGALKFKGSSGSLTVIAPA